MARDITVDFNNAVKAKSYTPRFFMKFEFDTGALRLWTGRGTTTFATEEYVGVGNVVSISSIDETIELRAATLNYVLNGATENLISLALAEDYQGRPATLWFAVLDQDKQIIANPYLLSRGRMDVMEIDDDPDEPKISLAVENAMADLERPRIVYYTDEDQQNLFPGDTFFSRVASLNDGKEVKFGRS